MSSAAVGLGVPGLTFQFFHVGKVAFKVLGDMRDVPSGAIDYQVSFIVQLQR
jgi:hypothetical protein